MDGDIRVVYSVMMNIRVQLLAHSGSTLAKALLIALRYSAVRRQFKNYSNSKQETKLIDYQTQQLKLVPLMASGFCFQMSHAYVMQIYN